MRAAFKEWAIIVDALGRGEQIIIFRKGGLAEDHGAFEIEHERFWLFPTLFHQQRQGVLPHAQKRFDEILIPLPSAEIVRLEYYAEVQFSRRIESLDTARRLGGSHIWSDE